MLKKLLLFVFLFIFSISLIEFSPLKAEAGEGASSIGAKSNITALAVLPDDDQLVFAGTPAGLYKSINGGASWVLVGLEGKRVDQISIDKSNPEHIYVVSGEDGLESTDGGKTFKKIFGWKEKFINTLLPEGSVSIGKEGFPQDKEINIIHFAVSNTDSNMVAVSADLCSPVGANVKECSTDIFLSKDMGVSWIPLRFQSSNPNASQIPKIVIRDKTIYTFTHVLPSDNPELSESEQVDIYENDKWKEGTNIIGAGFRDAAIIGPFIILATGEKGVLVSDKEVTKFEPIKDTDLPSNISVVASSLHNEGKLQDVTYIGTKSGVFKWDGQSIKRIWSIQDAATSIVTLPDGTIYIGTESNGIFTSSDNGASFIPSGQFRQARVYSLAVSSDNKYIYAATNQGLLVYSNGTWEKSNISRPVISLAVDSVTGDVYATDASDCKTGCKNGDNVSRIYVSKNQGKTFEELTGPKDKESLVYRRIAVINNVSGNNKKTVLYVTTNSNGGLYRTEAGSQALLWERVGNENGLYLSDVAVISEGNLLIAGVEMGSLDLNATKRDPETPGLFILKDNMWTKTEFTKPVLRVIAVGDMIYVGTVSDGAYECKIVTKKMICSQLAGTAHLGIKDLFYLSGASQIPGNTFRNMLIDPVYAADKVGGKLYVATDQGAKVISLGENPAKTYTGDRKEIKESEKNNTLNTILVIISAVFFLYLMYSSVKRRINKNKDK